jgi:hypothetical protein
MNKSCDVRIEFTNWSAEDIILKLTEYINDGFRLSGYNWEISSRNCDKTVKVDLSKCN